MAVEPVQNQSPSTNTVFAYFANFIVKTATKELNPSFIKFVSWILQLISAHTNQQLPFNH